MARLSGKNVGATVVEMFGPQAGRNYFADGVAATSVSPTLHVQVHGTGAVQVQENLSHVHVGERASNIGSQGPINTEKYADPTGWAPVGAVINAASGAQSRTLTIGTTDPTFVRVMVINAGGGWVHVETRWN